MQRIVLCCCVFTFDKQTLYTETDCMKERLGDSNTSEPSGLFVCITERVSIILHVTDAESGPVLLITHRGHVCSYTF